MIAQRQPSTEQLEAFRHLTQTEIARLVLWLLIEEALGRDLAAFRSQPQNLLPQPAEGGEELVV